MIIVKQALFSRKQRDFNLFCHVRGYFLMIYKASIAVFMLTCMSACGEVDETKGFDCQMVSTNGAQEVYRCENTEVICYGSRTNIGTCTPKNTK
jgi:hypothetical protein